jgi:zinc protease
VARIGEAVRRLVTDGPAPADLERARTLLQARWARRMESMEGRAAALASAEALGNIRTLDDEYAALGAATPEDVRRAAAEHLTADRVSGVLYLPTDRGDELTSEALESAFSRAPRTALPPPAVELPATRARRSVRGADTAGTLHVALPGADLLVRRKTGVPLVTLGAYVPRLDEPAAIAGVGALAIRAALRGAGGLDAAGLAFLAEGAGGSLGASAGADWLGVATSVLRDRLGDAAALLDLVVSEPSLSDDAIVAERRLLAAEARQVADDMFRFPFQLAFRAAFGDTSYGLPVSGLPETIDAITAADVRARHAALAAMRRTIVVVGDDEPERLAEEVAAVFGRLTSREAAGARPEARWLPEGGTALQVVPRDKAQSAFAMVFPGPPGGRRSGTPPRSGPRWRAGSAAGSSRRCATSGRWHTRWSPPRGRRRAPARSRPTSRLRPSARRRRGSRCCSSSAASPRRRSPTSSWSRR